MVGDDRRDDGGGAALIFPIQMQTSKNMAKLARIKPQIDAISEKVKAGYAKKTEAGMAGGGARPGGAERDDGEGT